MKFATYLLVTIITLWGVRAFSNMQEAAVFLGSLKVRDAEVSKVVVVGDGQVDVIFPVRHLLAPPPVAHDPGND